MYTMTRNIFYILISVVLLAVAVTARADDAPLTTRPLLQELGRQLLQGKQGSIVAIKPATGEIVCLVTNSPSGSNLSLAIGTAYAPGSTFKTAQALVMLSEGFISPEQVNDCNGGFTDGNIHVGCHKHATPLALADALAFSCNTWFLSNFMALLNDDFLYADPSEAITVWHKYMTSMGLGGPLGVDLTGERGGLVANAAYLNRRYKQGWDARTILWAGMGQGDITMTPLQMCNLAATIANRGFFFTPHIHQATASKPLAARFKRRRQTLVGRDAYGPVIEGMRRAVEKGTCTAARASYTVCGKTGTVENAGKDHSAFMGFAPMNDPKIAIAVYIEHGGFGSDMAVPIASLIMEMYLKGQLSETSKAKAKRLAKVRLF